MPSDVIIAVNHHLQRIVHGVCHIIYCDRKIVKWQIGRTIRSTVHFSNLNLINMWERSAAYRAAAGSSSSSR